ncbi:hypothetical protein WJX72_001893 [[Myrmecia] bisecta]|uniref:ATP synthase subunit f, mitochondrial n=1 Tax=[Myrmecia] bisecta TaxID=41462 RepID=A0AAW1QPG4_9CHLO
MSTFLNKAKTLKLKELTPYVKDYASQNLAPSVVQSRTTTFLNEYKKKHIDTGSVKPLFDTMVGLFFLSYAIAWPQEYKHYKAEQAAKLEGKKAH